MDVEVQQASFHESGHCVIGFFVGAQVSAYLGARGGTGRCKSALVVSPDDDPEPVEIRRALINVAGITAESAFGRFDEAASKADLLALRTNFETLRVMKSRWAGASFGTFRLMATGVAGELIRRARGHVVALASDLKAYDCGIDEDDVWRRCSDLPRSLAMKRWESAYVELLSAATSRLEERLTTHATVEKVHKGVLAYGHK